MKIQLSEFQSDHIELLAQWLMSEHVAPWFPHLKTHTAWAENLPHDGRQFVISADSQPIGYVRWTYVSRDVLNDIGLHDIPGNSADIDLLIGRKNMIDRGIAQEIIKLTLEKIRFEGIAKLVALTTSVDNIRAHRAFERAGFLIDREYYPEGFDKCYLMLRTT